MQARNHIKKTQLKAQIKTQGKQLAKTSFREA